MTIQEEILNGHKGWMQELREEAYCTDDQCTDPTGCAYCLCEWLDTELPADKPTRTNWDVLREDKQRVANFAYYDDCDDTFYALLTGYKERFETAEAAIAANLVWLDAPEE